MSNPEGVITLVGQRPGKTLSIMAGVHGDEPCDIRMFEKVLPNLQIER